MSRAWKATALALATGLCSVVIAVPAQAKTYPVTGGQATVTLSSEIASFLRARGITVSAVGPATVAEGSLKMPMVSGSVAVPSMRGVMVTKGGFKYTGPKRTLVVRGYMLSHGAHGASLSTVVSGRRIVIARMVTPTVHMSGTSGTMTGGLSLSAVWAHLINQLLGKHVVNAGEDIGDLIATVKVA